VPAGLPSRHRVLLKDGIAWTWESVQDRFRREQNQQLRDLLRFVSYGFIVQETLFRPILRAIVGKNESRLNLQGSPPQLFPLISSRKRVGLVHRLAGKAHMGHAPGGVPGIICGNQTAASPLLPKGRVGSTGSGGILGETSPGACQTAELPTWGSRVGAPLWDPAAAE
jgi:hypothetical protein